MSNQQQALSKRTTPVRFEKKRFWLSFRLSLKFTLLLYFYIEGMKRLRKKEETERESLEQNKDKIVLSSNGGDDKR